MRKPFNTSCDDAQQSLPAANGFGYRVSADSAASTGEAMVQAQSSYGLYQAEYHRIGTSNVGLAQASGGIVFVGLKPFEERKSKDCPYCLTPIPLAATRCPACTSSLEPLEPVAEPFDRVEKPSVEVGHRSSINCRCRGSSSGVFCSS